MRRLLTLCALTIAIVVSYSTPIHAVIIGPINSGNRVIRGAPGTEHLLGTLDVLAALVGRGCNVTATSTNNESVHPNTDLIIRSANNELVLSDVERDADGIINRPDLLLTLAPSRRPLRPTRTRRRLLRRLRSPRGLSRHATHDGRSATDTDAGYRTARTTPAACARGHTTTHARSGAAPHRRRMVARRHRRDALPASVPSQSDTAAHTAEVERLTPRISIRPHLPLTRGDVPEALRIQPDSRHARGQRFKSVTAHNPHGS